MRKYRPETGVAYGALVREYAALAMIRTLPDFFLDKGEHQGRIAGLLTRTREAVDSILEAYPYYDDRMRDDIGAVLDRFGKATRLNHQGRHIITMVCFTLEMAERHARRSPWPASGKHAQIRFIRDRGLRKAIRALTDLFLHYEENKSNAGIIPLCITGGRTLAEKWEEVTR